MDPLYYPAIPPYFRVPNDLEDAFQTAMAARSTAETSLRRLAAVVDPSQEQVRAQLLLLIALDCAKIASSGAICAIGDWLEEVEP